MQEQVAKLLEEALAENPSLFLIDWHMTPDHRIEVCVDGDEGLSLEEIIRISRHIEHNLDRETTDFSLTVSSPGLDRPLEMPRQYIKNIGRWLKVTPVEGKGIKGEILAADEEGVTLTWKVREPKPVGKGKHTVQKEEKILYTQIQKATIHINI